MTSHTGDDDRILQANLKRVFGERDASLRAAAIRDLYSPDAVLYEPDSIKTGHDAIGQAVEDLLASLPTAFVFSPIGPAVGHHGLARLRWRAGPPDGPAAVTGTDVARIEAGRIATLHVFIDPPGA
ncbi:nuclear transport factor 2 family protein [Enterovirga rhinocerotis]|uniref:SnoaL-like protein n=1 Tax=Enterovirga rhinocerotis TaxID=1339210 RepID=A0A4R7BJ96_9HYPH|nr:nuclear transport factor 2 family protein [Enterovirga rhinocerotis]TDR85231.1 SnoaL-like protein [Enterovirga rhinocerotis]